MRFSGYCLLAVLALAVFFAGCREKGDKAPPSGKIRIVATLFPLYDFSRNIGGDKVEVDLLLPPGMEAHSFEPKPKDIVKANGADLFVYTNRYMEPWAANIISGLDSKRTLIVDSSRGTKLLKVKEEHDHGQSDAGESAGHGDGVDPHLWLDFANARIMVDNILAGLVAKDPANAAVYNLNARRYKEQLAALDEKYRKALVSCQKKVFLHGGHYAFGYLARRYGLEYESAYAASANSEPAPAKIAALVEQMRKYGIRYIYTEELVEPRMAQTIARETGATILRLHAAHNISKQDLAAGATFISLMERNLDNLRIGLQCKEK